VSFSTRCMTTADWTISPYFQAAEFQAPEKVGYEFVIWLNQVRRRAGVPMHITSSYRTHAHNVEVGGAQDSAHEDIPCDAVDIGKTPTPDDPHWNHARFEIIAAALSLGCVRYGEYEDGSIHLDRTEDRRPAREAWVQVDNPAH